MSVRPSGHSGAALLVFALALVAWAPQGAAVEACAPAPDASRIAVAGGSLTEIIYALGEAHRIVAVDRTSNYPEQALTLPQIGYVRALSLEGMLSLSPTLVLGEHDMGPPEIVDRLAALGVATIRVPETHDAEGIAAKVRCVAAALGVPEEGETLVTDRLGDARRSLPAPDAAPRGLVILRLQNGAPVAAGRATSGDGLLRMAGAANVLDGIEGWKPLSGEAMAASAPEFIVITESGLTEAGGLDALLRHPTIRFSPAAQSGRIYSMDAMAMLGFGLRTADIARALRRHIADADPDA